MSRNPHGTILQRRRYSGKLQQTFAALSGDTNPMHVDPVAARRTLVGGCAVHGIHQALAALETALTHFARKKKSDRTISGFKALFLKPVLVGDVVALHLAKITEKDCLVIAQVGGEVVCRTTIQFSPISPAGETSLPPLALESVKELLFSELANQAGELPLGLDALLAHQLFPLATSMLGSARMAATLALSRLVGMHCPGLHSIFAEATVSYEGTDASDALHYRVEGTDERFNRVTLAVHGGRLQGQLVVFFRPPPQPQPGMAEIMRLVEPGRFAKSHALIVGGSRGLGEFTAKIIAAGGGVPIITYYQGEADAQRIAGDIRSAGGRCEVMQLDVRRGEKAVQKLFSGKRAPRSLYYFATPKIFGRRRGFFDHDMLREFQEVYVTAFGRLVDSAALNCPANLRVFYPSSVAVTEPLRELTEYAMAKRLAEEMCAFYNQHSRKMEIIVERLPRLKTDQTNSILSLPAADTLEVMLPIVERVEKF